MKAQVTRRAVPQRDIRAAKQGNAAEAIGQLRHGEELYCLTFGQFSLIDALVHLVGQTGPADVVLATWTAAEADLTTAARLIEDSAITRLRMIVDQSFMARANAVGLARHLRALFGDTCIRTTRCHAKFATIRSAEWSLAVRTSMNLNTNPRLENIEISDDPRLCGFLESIADQLFEEQPAGLFDGDLPQLAGTRSIDRRGTIQTGVVGSLGRAVAAPRIKGLRPASVGVPP